MKAETYTTANGSNMDNIVYNDNMTLEEVATDLRKCYDNWDYAIVTFANGNTEYIEK